MTDYDAELAKRQQAKRAIFWYRLSISLYTATIFCHIITIVMLLSEDPWELWFFGGIATLVLGHYALWLAKCERALLEREDA